MSERIKYLLRRLNEAPLHLVVYIVWIRLKKVLYRPYYASFNNILRGNEFLLKVDKKPISKRGEILRKDLYNNLESCDYLFSDWNGLSFKCLGYGANSIPQGDSWHKDIFHNYEWKKQYFNNINYVASHQYCDVKIPWEYSRFQYSLWMSKAAINGKNSSLLPFESVVDDWIKNNRAAYGVNWSCSMEVSIRAVNLSIAYLVTYNKLKDDLRSKIYLSLVEHSKFIERFPEVSDVNGNHYLSNLMGAHVINTVIYSTDLRRVSESAERFALEAQRQFDLDGCHFEASPVYHRLCLEMVAVVVACSVSIRNCTLSVKKLLDILEKGLDFCESISSNYKLPVIGDCDSGHVFWFGSDARSYLDLEQFFYMVTGKRNRYESIEEKAAWLASIAGVNCRDWLGDKCSSSRKNNLETFSKSGFVSTHNDGLLSVMRVGPQGLKGRASHDHDDALSIWTTFNERDILVEEGCHSYTLDRVIRDRNICSRAHNLLLPFGSNRFSPGKGSVMRTVRGAATAKSWSHGLLEGSKSYIEASLDVSNPNQDVFEKCSRRIEIELAGSESLMTVKDDWVFLNASRAELRWHFGPDLFPSILKEGEAVCVLDENGSRVFEICFSADVAYKIFSFDYDFSPVYGSSSRCKGISLVTNNILLTGKIQTRFYFFNPRE